MIVLHNHDRLEASVRVQFIGTLSNHIRKGLVSSLYSMFD